MVTSESLLASIKAAFPFVKMPARGKIIYQDSFDGYFDGLLDDLESYRGGEVSIELIRLLHQDLSSLSSDAWLWILPYYLEYCLSVEAEYTQMEVVFLVYALSPTLMKSRVDVLKRLSSFSKGQVLCLIFFVEWCQGHKFWKDHIPNELGQARELLNQALMAKAS